MKMNKLITTAAVLALIGLASVGTASAQTFSTGDLILNFRLNTVTSGGQDLEYDLGQASSFNFLLNQSSIVNLSSSLTSVYGSGWASNSALVYSIVGFTGNGSTQANNNVYLSNPGNTLAITATNPAATTTTTSALANIYGSGFGTAVGSAYSVSTNSVNSYTDVLTNYDAQQGGSAYTSDYGLGLGSIGATEAGIGSSLDLIHQTPQTGGSHGVALTPAASTDVGTFGVSSTGVVSFSPVVAVPEPASYVLGGIAAVLFAIMHRRSKIQA